METDSVPTNEKGRRYRGPRQSRFTRSRKSELTLTNDVPLARIEQLKQTKFYDYEFLWNQFLDGIMCEGEIFYKMNGARRVVVKSSRFVLTDDVKVAQNVVAAIMLQEIGLDPQSKDPANWIDSSTLKQRYEEAVADSAREAEEEEELKEEEAKLNDQMQHLTQVGLKFANIAIEKLMGGSPPSPVSMPSASDIEKMMGVINQPSDTSSGVTIEKVISIVNGSISPTNEQ